MSKSGPHEGTLLVNPLMHMATAYVLLRPFFAPLNESKGSGFLDESNWKFIGEADMDSELQGASPGHGQELTDELHPHLELERTMVHVPDIKPGDFVAWHCDSKSTYTPKHYFNCQLPLPLQPCYVKVLRRGPLLTFLLHLDSYPFRRQGPQRPWGL